MGERWGLPRDFVRYASFTFLFNLDVWEFVKVMISGAYMGPINLDTFIASDDIGIDYSLYLILWTVCIAVIGCGFLKLMRFSSTENRCTCYFTWRE